MAEQNQPEDKKGHCGYGRCCSAAAVLVVLAFMGMSAAIGYLFGKNCAMSSMACMKQGACAHGGMAGMSCPVTGATGQAPAEKK